MPDYTPEQFARALEQSVGKTPKAAVAVVKRGALNVKNDARRNVRASAPVHSAHAYAAITYDVDVERTEIVAEIGYDKDKDKGSGKRTGPGGLGNILEFGSANNPPHRDVGRALDDEEPRFADALGDMGEKLLPE